MRHNLPRRGARKHESPIVNLDDKDGPGTHWGAYKKNRDEVMYLDSFENLRPPPDLMDYFDVGSNVKYNCEQYHKYDTVVCGHLCFKFLRNQL